jgi:hypothetical protein
VWPGLRGLPGASGMGEALPGGDRTAEQGTWHPVYPGASRRAVGPMGAGRGKQGVIGGHAP